MEPATSGEFPTFLTEVLMWLAIESRRLNEEEEATKSVVVAAAGRLKHGTVEKIVQRIKSVGEVHLAAAGKVEVHSLDADHAELNGQHGHVERAFDDGKFRYSA